MKLIFVFAGGTVFGAVLGAVIMLVVFPYLFWGGVDMSETMSVLYSPEEAEDLVTLSESRFREEAEGQDAIHWAKGSISVTQHASYDEIFYIQLNEDFEAGPGPNYWIYLNSKTDINTLQDFESDMGRIKLAQLRDFNGEQVYTAFPAQMYEKRAVTIWCETFNQYIGSANIDLSDRSVLQPAQ